MTDLMGIRTLVLGYYSKMRVKGISAKAFGAKALPRQQRERLGCHAGTMLAPVLLALTGTTSVPTALVLSRRVQLPSTAVDSVKNDSSGIGLSKLIGQADSIMLS
uniref:Uncharacterized protein n=1 Tax=Oryza meridionalis TaxID=40149 RepID=A0A0E0EPE2_9ORYZ